ncbi:hypothetical protein RRG08_006700 [Elysia crispata]|uniref:PiggyBac transposable element-derived protein domain-containing protein n=1 Tax=Elysia crispata TaxID=231223 RepID=A0AAE0YWC4_9GAST|nr:hypothetical protein RRG08_006700 [Elysia crispata]
MLKSRSTRILQDPDDPDFTPLPNPLPSQTRIDRLTVAAEAEDCGTAGDDEENCRPSGVHKWKKRTLDKRVQDFLKNEGPVEELFSGCHSPGQYFTTFFDNSIVDDLIFQTTLYITQQERRVSTVTLQDILEFIGINIIMGYHVLPSYTHYWCEDPDVSVPFISSVLTRNRFSQIKCSC